MGDDKKTYDARDQLLLWCSGTCVAPSLSCSSPCLNSSRSRPRAPVLCRLHHMHPTQVGDVGAAALAGAVMAPSGLQRLNLNFNKLTGEALAALADALISNSGACAHEAACMLHTCTDVRACTHAGVLA